MTKEERKEYIKARMQLAYLIGVNVYAGKKGKELFKQKVVTNNPYVA